MHESEIADESFLDEPGTVWGEARIEGRFRYSLYDAGSGGATLVLRANGRDQFIPCEGRLARQVTNLQGKNVIVALGRGIATKVSPSER